MALNKILCVDDSATDLANMKQICSAAGFSVVTAVSGEEALEVADREMPDLVLMDIVMRPLNGFQACRKLSRGSKTKDIPVILVSSKGEEADKIWGQEQGAKGYIVKPFDSDKIMSEINKFR